MLHCFVPVSQKLILANFCPTGTVPVCGSAKEGKEEKIPFSNSVNEKTYFKAQLAACGKDLK